MRKRKNTFQCLCCVLADTLTRSFSFSAQHHVICDGTMSTPHFYPQIFVLLPRQEDRRIQTIAVDGDIQPGASHVRLSLTGTRQTL